MASKHFECIILSLSLLCLSLMSSPTKLVEARRLHEGLLPEIPKPGLPELPPLPKVELPHPLEIPTLPKPEIPTLPIPELPKIPQLPSLPHLPHQFKATLPATVPEEIKPTHSTP